MIPHKSKGHPSRSQNLPTLPASIWYLLGKTDSNSLRRASCFFLIAAFVASMPVLAQDDTERSRAMQFIGKYCADCHDDQTLKAGLDLTHLEFKPNDDANFATWVKVHDRVNAGEMPPKKKPRPEAVGTDRRS